MEQFQLLVLSGIATWFCCYRTKQEVINYVFAEVGDIDHNLIQLLNNKDAKGNDKQIKDVNNNRALESIYGATAIGLFAKLYCIINNYWMLVLNFIY